jgi:hypothetical protein
MSASSHPMHNSITTRHSVRCAIDLCQLALTIVTLALLPNHTLSAQAGTAPRLAVAQSAGRAGPFPIGFYSLGANDPALNLATASSLGFTIAGPQYGGLSTANLARYRGAVEHGLRIVVQVAAPISHGFLAIELDTMAVLQALGPQIATILQDTTLGPAVAWWMVSPEELRPWRSIEMKYLDYVVRAIHEMEDALGAPRRPVCVYQPSNRTARWLSVVGGHSDLICAAAYANRKPPPHSWVEWAVAQAVDASRSLPSHPPAIAVLEMAFDPPAYTSASDSLIRLTARHDAFLAALVGARGILIWSAFRRASVARSFDAYLDGYASVARALNGEAHLGLILLDGTPDSTLSVTMPEQDSLQTIAGEGTRTVTVHVVFWRALQYRDSRYLLLTSSSLTPVPLTVHLKATAVGTAMTNVFSGERLLLRSDTFRLSLAPMETLAFRLEGPG